MSFVTTGARICRLFLELEITPKYREDVIMNLDSEDYVEGPIEDTLNKKGEMWVFGKEVSGRDIYIPQFGIK